MEAPPQELRWLRVVCADRPQDGPQRQLSLWLRGSCPLVQGQGQAAGQRARRVRGPRDHLPATVIRKFSHSRGTKRVGPVHFLPVWSPFKREGSPSWPKAFSSAL